MNCPSCGEKNEPGVATCSLCGGAMAKPAPKPEPGRSASGRLAPPPAAIPPPPPRPAPAPPPAAPPRPASVRLASAPVPAAVPRGAPAAPRPGLPVTRHILSRLGLPPLVLEPGTVVQIGRDPACWLSVPSTKVSRVHAEIRWDQGKPVIADLGSQNGTAVGGRPVKEHPLAPGDEIQIGPLLMTYEVGDPVRLMADAHSVTGRHSKTIGDMAPPMTGAIGEAGLAEVIQGLELNVKTGTLSVYDRGTFGWLTVHEGVPGAAEVGHQATPAQADAAKTLDDEAVLALLGIKQGRYVFEPEPRTPEKRMKTTITALLLEWSRRAAT